MIAFFLSVLGGLGVCKSISQYSVAAVKNFIFHSTFRYFVFFIIHFFLFISDTCFYNRVNINSTQFLISTIYNLSSAFECQSKCWNPSIKCQFFTFYTVNETKDTICYLRSSASGNKVISENYITGPVNCSRMIGIQLKVKLQKYQHNSIQLKEKISNTLSIS